ncbi:related to SLY41 protein [Cephalotrichum gorgonifer]|uniref:Related to SLY41 protein n=1 Tax=Cephalotrichum gorgonifer TaxID=2041049 RepID=A0AAE8N686_9PEZI|nr:related to SLY41 protein [Cephalotrichum gorgonifer]
MIAPLPLDKNLNPKTSLDLPQPQSSSLPDTQPTQSSGLPKKIPHTGTPQTMPHPTFSGADRVPPVGRGKQHNDSNGASNGLEKFPEYDTTAHLNLGAPTKWPPRRDSNYPRAGSTKGHTRQKSLSQAIRTIRTRNGSVSQNVHEITEALKAPVSGRLIFLCVLWYTSSVLTNTSSKSILTTFDKPATLTIVQFALVSSYCLLCSWLASTFAFVRDNVPALRHPVRAPSVEVIRTTLPLAFFQIGGHLLSSNATSMIPVSLVHTIKGLSPLFTVVAYRVIFDIRYPASTYLSLIPLTVGVMLACSGNHSFDGQLLGVFYALLAALIFVTQNIFSKRLFNEAAVAEAEGLGAKSRKLDKLTLLCYSSGLALILTTPIWFWTDGITILRDFLHDGSLDLNDMPHSLDHGRLFLEFIFNGTFHFGQNILAFVLLSMVSPVTYSVASLLKRVFVIVVTLVWFRSPTTYIQGVGIFLTFVGLYLYDRSNASNKADRRARTMTDSKIQPLLPLSGRQEEPAPPVHRHPHAQYANGHAHNGDGGRRDDGRVARPRGMSNAPLPPRTRQEDTWLPVDKAIGVQ